MRNGNAVCAILAMDLDIRDHSNSDTGGFNSLQERFTSEDWRGLIFHMVAFIFVFAFNAYYLRCFPSGAYGNFLMNSLALKASFNN